MKCITDPATKPPVQKTLQPSQTLWLPVLPSPRLDTQGCPSDLMIKLRPTDHHEWCATMAVTHPKTMPQAVSYFTCNGINETVKAHAFSIEPRALDEDDHTIPYTLYHLRTPVIVENLLAVACIVDILEQKVGGRAVEVGNKELVRGEEYQVTSASMTQGTKTFLSVTIPSLGVRGKPIDLRADDHKGASTKTLHMTLIDGSSRPFYLSVETSFTPVINLLSLLLLLCTDIDRHIYWYDRVQCV
jgi:hypothetical protein